MNNLFPPDGRTPGRNERSPLDGPDTDHILPDLLAALERAGAPATLTSARLNRATDHLQTCFACSLGVRLLGDAVAETTTLRRAPGRPHHGPDDAELAVYITVASVAGLPAADAQFPRVKAHLKRCSPCSALVRDELNEPLIDSADSVDPVDAPGSIPTDDQPTLADAPTPVPSSAALDSPGPRWVEFQRPNGERARLLLAPYIIEVGDRTVSITSSAPGARIEVEYVSALRSGERDRLTQGVAGAQAIKQEQSFTIDLRDDPRSASWARIKVHLQALSTGRLICYLTSHQIFSADDTSQRVGGVLWRLERVSADGRPELLAVGATSPDVVSKISSKARGDLQLTLRAADRDWVVPLLIQSADNSPNP